MEGRELIIDRAVDKDTAVANFSVEKKKEKEESDKRNLYLANEGCTSLRLMCMYSRVTNKSTSRY